MFDGGVKMMFNGATRLPLCRCDLALGFFGPTAPLLEIKVPFIL
jgi:hypothetical protein